MFENIKLTGKGIKYIRDKDNTKTEVLDGIDNFVEGTKISIIHTIMIIRGRYGND